MPAQTWKELPSQSRFPRALERFLDDFGHRAVYEADVINPRWRDDPAFILDQVRHALDMPVQRDPRLAARQIRDAAWQEVRRLPFWRRFWIRWLVRHVQRGVALREGSKSGMVASLWPTRRWLLEIGRRLMVARQIAQPEHVFHLTKADVLSLLRGHWHGGGAAALVQDRLAQRQAWLKSIPPEVVIEGDNRDQMIEVPDLPSAFDGQVWHGTGVSSGRATAVARVIHHPDEGVRLEHGQILVAPSTDPGWTPLFLRASAVVLETGGYLSHGAIVAREFGLPAVVNIPGLLSHIKDAEILTVDGDAATVRGRN
jgi:pyruvate,water dikinase